MKNKSLCLERDAFRCRTCGSAGELDAAKLVDRSGEISYHLSNLVTLCRECVEIKDSLESLGDNNKLGVILCGGKATRMYPQTRTINKHLLPIGIIPMVFYPIKTLQKMGIKRVVIVMDQFSTLITETLGSGRSFGMNFSYRIQDGSFGIADALASAKDVARPNDQIVCILGDNIFDHKQLNTDTDIDDDDKACIFVKQVSNPQDYGVARIKDNRVLEIIEKPKEFVSDLEVVGIYIYPYDVFDVIEQIKPSPRGELEVTTINNFYIKNNKLQYKMFNGYWGDAGGGIHRYAECNMHGAKLANISAEEIDGFRSIVFDDR